VLAQGLQKKSFASIRKHSQAELALSALAGRVNSPSHACGTDDVYFTLTADMPNRSLVKVGARLSFDLEPDPTRQGEQCATHFKAAS